MADTNVEDKSSIFGFTFETLEKNEPEPTTLMELCLDVTKDIETHHFEKSLLTRKLVDQVNIKSDGNVFHEIFRYRPHDISTMSPQNVDLHEGEWGTVGSIISWNYVHEGKEKITKNKIEAIDEEKKSVTFKIIGGDLLELYKNFSLTVDVDTNGEDNLVTWAFYYEKLNEDVPEPTTLMEFCINVTKDIENHHLK